jgi:hypothetical protein
MKKAFLFLLLLCLIISCDKYPDPSVTALKDYTFSFQTTQGNKYFQGEWVGDSILFKAYTNQSQVADSIYVLFDIQLGDGTITVQSAYMNTFGEVSLKWRLGTGSFDQKLRARIYDLSGKYLTSSTLAVYAYRNDGWDPSASGPDAGMIGLVADTVNKVTYMVSNNTLYRQGEKYFIWNAITDANVISPRTINIDRNRVIYISTWNGELIKSTDHGLSWDKCTKPYPDRSEYIYVYVSNDNYVWVYAWDHRTRYSADGGSTWTDIDPQSGITAQGFGNIFRLKDGSLLYHGGNCCNLNRSFDNGLTWTKLTTPGYSNKIYVNDKDEIFLCSQFGGTTIYKSTDYGLTFTSVYSVSPQWNTSMENTFNKWGNFYYILIPGYGILKTSDPGNPDSYTEFYRNSDLFNLFIDHNGVLIAKTLNTNTVFYYKNSR